MSNLLGGKKRKKKKRKKLGKKAADSADCCIFDALDSPCYVATAAHGEGSDELMLLRRYRDEVLRPTAPGRAFIRVYYVLGRYPAWLVRRSPAFKRATRRGLRPVVKHAVQRVNGRS